MRLFFYVLKDYLKFVTGAVVLFTALVILFDFIHKTTRYFEKYQPQTTDMVKLYIYQIPVILNQALPIASLLASVITMILLSRTNEITAMRAAGMGPLRIASPVAVGGLFLSLSSLLIGEWVLPESSKKMHYIKEIVIENRGNDPGIILGSWFRDQSRLINFDSYDSHQKKFSYIKIISTGPSFRPKEIIEADDALFQASDEKWKLNNVRIRYFNPNGTLADSETRDFQIEEFGIDPKKLKEDKREAAERSMGELKEMIERGEKAGSDISSYKIEVQSKFAFHFAAFVVALMGLRFAYRSERSLETVRGVLIALGTGLSYWVIMTGGHLLAYRGILPAWLAAWLANISILTIAIQNLKKEMKS